jgi:hypothetical protein
MPIIIEEPRFNYVKLFEEYASGTAINRPNASSPRASADKTTAQMIRNTA